MLHVERKCRLTPLGWFVQDVPVLVVEDETLLWMDLEDALKNGGYTPEFAATGEQAVKRLEAADGTRALITDINLQGEITGWDVARRAREMFPSLPVVYVSSVPRDEWTAQGVPKSIFIQKPFAPAQIVAAVSHLLNTAEPDASE